MTDKTRNAGDLRQRRIDAYRRSLDVVISLGLLLLTLPILTLVIVGSAMSLRTHPLFVQDRVGRGGELFRFLKVRTLPREVPAYIDKHQLPQDAIPAFCRLLRRLHLDELPQLLLVLRGHMSLVGPRPEMGHLHGEMPPEFAALRTSVRPGCTGLWQVSAARTELISASPQYDEVYLAHRTLRLDLWVLYRTALQMVGLGRCITLDDVPAWSLREEMPEAIIASTGAQQPVAMTAAAGR